MVVNLTKNKSFNDFSRSRGKDSEYENMDSDVCTEDDDRGAVGHLGNDIIKKRDQRDSEQREIDEFEEEERKIFALESQVRRNLKKILYKPCQIFYQYLE